jgi:hypothetical protein
MLCVAHPTLTSVAISAQGDYVCIYPPVDPVKAKHYSKLLKESSRISLAGEVLTK